jgi:hypothetical protein
MATMVERAFQPGDRTFVPSDAPGMSNGVVFEDDGETGYFYALDLTKSNDQIVDALHIYNVASVTDGHLPSTLCIIWSEDGTKAALLINGYAHAVFDFSAQRGFCRTNFRNFADRSPHGWQSSDHSWSDQAVAWLR